MEPENLRFGGGAAESAITPQVAAILLVALILMFALPRAKVIAVFLLAYFIIPIGNVVVLGGFHFTALRILTFAGLGLMAISKKETGPRFPGGFNGIDLVVVLWSIAAVITFYLQYLETGALVRILGDFVDELGGYLVVRFLITDKTVVERAVKSLAWVCVILGITMTYERIGHLNVFGLLGGISREVVFRDGRVRASGSMGCLYAGAFAAVLIPVFLWLWTNRKSALLGFGGIAGAIAIVITSNASTSLMAMAGTLVGLAFWPFRKNMRLVRWGIASGLISLHMVMKAPVWALIGRIDLTGSSSGEHREEILDNCIRHFSDWWLIGTKHYNDWGWGMWDLCNQFVAVALTGGLISLVFYIMIFKRGFAALGNTRKLIDGDRGQEWFLWCMGADLFATIVASFGINSVPEIFMGFFPLLACISVTAFEAREAVRVKAPILGDAQPAGAPLRVLKPSLGQRVSRYARANGNAQSKIAPTR